MTAYYNEWDAYAAQWLRNLIAAGHLPPGDVDERSITDVEPEELAGYTQHHFFAGIGGWALATRLASVGDTERIVTGSPPCQPFSTAGRGGGYADERHLAPHWLRLVAAIRPDWVFGEQVAAAIRKDDWLDDLLDALEAEGYATGATVLPACSVGAPHIRQRLWVTAWLADSNALRWQGQSWSRPEEKQRVAELCGVGGVVNSESAGRKAQPEECGQQQGFRQTDAFTALGWTGGVADSKHQGHRRSNRSPSEGLWNAVERRSSDFECESTNAPQTGWNDPDWLYCRDGKWRPVESGLKPLAHGIPGRVGRLRAYGNAIVPQVAAEVIKEAMNYDY